MARANDSYYVIILRSPVVTAHLFSLNFDMRRDGIAYEVRKNAKESRKRNGAPVHTPHYCANPTMFEAYHLNGFPRPIVNPVQSNMSRDGRTYRGTVERIAEYKSSSLLTNGHSPNILSTFPY
jgi:hypothetical protein